MEGRLSQAIAYIQAGDRQTAARILASLLRDDPRNEGAWLWLSAALTDPGRQRFCLEKVLSINPGNTLARAELDKLLQRYNAATVPVRLQEPDTLMENKSIPLIEIPPEPSIEVIENPAKPPPLEETRPVQVEPPVEDAAEEVEETPPAPPVEKEPKPAHEPEAVRAFTVPDGREAGQDLEDEDDLEPEPAAESVPTFAFPIQGEALSQSPAEYTRSDYVITMGWVTPFRGADRVILLEPDALIVANPDLEYLSLIRQQLVVGPVPHQLLGLSPRIYPLDDIDWISANARGRSMHLRYHKGGWQHEATLRFYNRDECTDAFNALQRRLGAGFTRSDRQTSRILIALALVLLVALAGVFTAAMLQASGISAAGVVAGGLLIVAVLIWLAPMLVNPPLRMTLAKKPPKS